MRDRLIVGTRKGLFVFSKRRGGKWELASSSFVGDPVTMVLADARDDTLYAALDLGHFGTKLHRSEDEGASWTEVAVPEYPQGSDQALKSIWCLESAGKDRDGSLWAGTIPGGLFRSDDRGESWKLDVGLWEMPEREKWMGGGYDHPGIHSVCVDPNDSSRILLGVSVGGVWVTDDAGESWRCSADGMYAEYMPPERREDGVAQDPHRIVRSKTSPDVLWAQHHNGVFRSTDGGSSWNEIHPPPSKFGFACAVHPEDPETAWLVPLVKDECRIPVDGKVVVARTRDGGESFDVLREGLPQENAYDVVYRHSLDIDASGDVLAMGSTTGSLWLTENQGDSWMTVSNYLPPIYCVRFG